MSRGEKVNAWKRRLERRTGTAGREVEGEMQLVSKRVTKIARGVRNDVARAGWKIGPAYESVQRRTRRRLTQPGPSPRRTA
jgi:hypothetical protein